MAGEGVSKPVVCLGVFVAIHTVAFVVVVVIQVLHIEELKSADAELGNELEIFIRGIEGDHGDFAVELSSALLRAGEAAEVVSERRSKRQAIGNIFLDLLKTQETIIEKHCKNKTKVCSRGYKGAQGPIGNKGILGAVGIKGIKGEPGYSGVNGSKGDTGPRGDPGLKGEPGIKGVSGEVGPPGDRGDTGSKGVQGIKGSAGLSGPKGQTGDLGIQGPIGNPGPKGDAGTNGTKGDPGAAGAKGSKGDPGANGRTVDQLQPGCECLRKPVIRGLKTETKRVRLGSSMTLTCSADGNPPPTIQWTGSSSHLPSITVHSVTSRDFKTYHCTASNVFGKDTKNITVVRA